MAVHTITAKQVLSRVRQVFPNVGETYVLNIINDALVESGMYHTKVEYAKTDLEKTRCGILLMITVLVKR